MYADKQNVELLNTVYQNAEMAKATMDHVLQKVEDSSLESELHEQREQYANYAPRARDVLGVYHVTPEGIPPMQKISSKVGIAMNTFMDNTSSHIAEMVIEGSTMGIVDMTKQLKEHSGCEQSVRQLGEELLQFEQRAVERLKTFL